MKLNERMERRLAVLDCVVMGVVLIATIDSRLKGEAQGGNQTEARTEQIEATIVIITPTGTTEVKIGEEVEPTKSDIIVRTEPAAEPSRTGTTEPSADLPAQVDRTEQAVQPAPERPTAPPGEVSENPAQKPGRESVEGTPEAVPHGEAVHPSEALTQVGEPQYWNVQNGKIYVPGFGWIDEIGEGQGTVAEDIYEGGNKISIMDQKDCDETPLQRCFFSEDVQKRS